MIRNVCSAIVCPVALRGAAYGLCFLGAVYAAGADAPRLLRVTGTVQAVHSVDLRVPSVEGQGGNVTLTRLIQNGARVKAGELIAEFDPTTEIRAAREAHAKYDDLAHQVEQKQAEHVSNVEKRLSELRGAEADVKKAQIEIRKGPILSAIDQDKNKVHLEDAQAHVASLQRSGEAHDRAEIAEVRVLELQRDRQKIAVERAERNTDRLILHAPLAGMVALQNVFRNNSMGHAQEGDQLWPGSPLVRLFDPSLMAVVVSISEADRAVLRKGMHATVHLDAFPDTAFPARFENASPVATAGLGTPVKNFSGRFVLEQSDARLLPDLSAAVDVEVAR
jgi:HlyD family secretion protein